MLGTYRYPWWAHLIGWLIVTFVVSPIVKYAFSSMSEYGLFRVNLFSIIRFLAFIILSSSIDLNVCL
jgi:hypothetical protein